MKHSNILIVDAAINLILGGLLIAFPPAVVKFLGLPMAEKSFYPSIQGGIIRSEALSGHGGTRSLCNARAKSTEHNRHLYVPIIP